MVPHLSISQLHHFILRAELEKWVTEDGHLTLNVTYQMIELFVGTLCQCAQLLAFVIRSASWHLHASYIRVDPHLADAFFLNDYLTTLKLITRLFSTSASNAISASTAEVAGTTTSLRVVRNL